MSKTLAALVLVFLVFGCAQQPAPLKQQVVEGEKTGTLLVSLTDQPSAGYESIWVTIAGVEVHKDGEWQTVFEGSKTFDLLKLNGAKELIGQEEIPAGKYTQVRLNVSKVSLIEGGQEKPVKVPSGKIKLVKNFEVTEGQETEIVIDFDPYSVILEAKELILKPVIRVLTVQEFAEKVKQEKKEKEGNAGEKAKVKITQLSFPPTAMPGEKISIVWKVSGGKDGNIEHTAVHWDTVGGHRENINEYPNRSEILTGTSPQDFSVEITVPETGSVFFRAHAIVDGKHAYSPEQEIRIVQEQVQQETQEFTAMVNDARFDPASIEVKKGSLVKITFTIDTTNVSFGGIDIKSSEFETGTISPGASKQVSFTATKSFTVTGYWPASGIKKGEMQVTVK